MNVNLVMSNDTPVIENHQNVLMSELNSLPPRGCKSLILNHVINYTLGFATDIIEIKLSAIIA